MQRIVRKAFGALLTVPSAGRPLLVPQQRAALVPMLTKEAAMTEDELVAALAGNRLLRSHRGRLERDLAAIRASRPAQAAERYAEPHIARVSAPEGAAELKRGADGHFHATCSVVAGKTFTALWDSGATDCYLSRDVVQNHLRIKDPDNELIFDGATTLGDQFTKIPCATKSLDWLIEGILVRGVATSILRGGENINIVGESLIDQLDMARKDGRQFISRRTSK